MRRELRPAGSGLAIWLAAGIGVGVILLGWFGLRASREWQRSSVHLVERRANEAARLLVTALTRDMRAVQTSVLSSTACDEFSFDAPRGVMTLAASAFARYPYPEAFFAWTAEDAPARAMFFTRSDRPPVWARLSPQHDRFPVRLVTDERVAAELLGRIEEDFRRGRLLSVFEAEIAGAAHQTVMRLRYVDDYRQDPAGACGFMVNLGWVREHYFPELARETVRIGGDDAGLAVGIQDDAGRTVVSTGAFPTPELISRYTFPLVFLDPLAVRVNPPVGLPRRSWVVMASGAGDPALASAIRGGNRTVAFASVAAAVLAVGLVLTARAVRANAAVSEMRAEFVSSVTHELKTPLASIRALGDTLTSGRLTTAAAQREYAGLVVQEAKRLARLVDNLLAHARVTDIADVYSFEPLVIDDLVRAALAGFDQQLRSEHFQVHVDLPPGLPCIRADRSAVQLVLENLIDNAIRYSKDTRKLAIGADVHRDTVAIRLSDQGIGIAADEIDQVTVKFVRGRNASAGGSGLGLAIVKRIVTDHGGTLAIHSVLGAGTVVTVSFPAAHPVAEESMGMRV